MAEWISVKDRLPEDGETVLTYKDFKEQYEIIEQNGNIYTVKERTK